MIDQTTKRVVYMTPKRYWKAFYEFKRLMANAIAINPKLPTIEIMPCKELTETQERLAEADKVIEWYGDQDSWLYCHRALFGNSDYYRIMANDSTPEGDDIYAGRRAREYMAKYMKGEK